MQIIRRGQHQAPSDRRGFKRLVPTGIVGWIALAGGGVALAVAGYLLVLGLNGTATSAAGFDISYTPANAVAVPTAGSSAGLNCTIAFNSPSSITLGATDVLPGDGCEYRVEVSNTGAEDAILQRFALDSPDWVDATASVVTTLDGDQCGKALVGTLATTGSSLFSVSAAVDFGPNVAPGDSFNFVSGVDGWEWAIPALDNSATVCS